MYSSNCKRRRRNTRKKGGASSKKWVTALKAAEKTLGKTGSLKQAKKTLRKQALSNARKLFGAVGSI